MAFFLAENESSALLERFAAVGERLRKAIAASGRRSEDVKLIAVSKTHPASLVAELAASWNGRPVFGENYAQEAVQKQTDVASLLLKAFGGAAPTPEWHFIGHVQSRKAREIVGRFTLLHTLDSAKLALQIEKTVRDNNLSPQDVLVQINIGEEPQKHGVPPHEAEVLLNALSGMAAVRVQGLMCIPPNLENAEDSRRYFARLRTLRDNLREKCGAALPHLSMGMSHDCVVAIEEGATMVRIGTDIFGARSRAE